MTYIPRKLDPEFPLHITARTNGKAQFPIPLAEAWELFSDQLFLINKFYDIRIHAFVMMPNHVHLIVRDPSSQISNGIGYFLRESSKEIGRRRKNVGRLWGSRFHSTLIGSPYYYLNAYKYVYRNPVRARLCRSPFDYQFSTLPALIGDRKTIVPVEEDSTLFENFESSVRWLETQPQKAVEDAIRKGLRRKRFLPPRNELNHQPIQLERLAITKK